MVSILLQVGSLQEQNGSLSEKLSQAEARLTEAQESSGNKAKTLAVELEQARSQSSQIQVMNSYSLTPCVVHCEL